MHTDLLADMRLLTHYMMLAMCWHLSRAAVEVHQDCQDLVALLP